jgi:hypothetical protein
MLPAGFSSMSSVLHPEVLIGSQPGQPSLALAAAGAQRYVWQSAFGPMLIEVRDGAAFVNGHRVTPFKQTLNETLDDARSNAPSA